MCSICSSFSCSNPLRTEDSIWLKRASACREASLVAAIFSEVDLAPSDSSAIRLRSCSFTCSVFDSVSRTPSSESASCRIRSSFCRAPLKIAPSCSSGVHAPTASAMDWFSVSFTPMRR